MQSSVKSEQNQSNLLFSIFINFRRRTRWTTACWATRLSSPQWPTSTRLRTSCGPCRRPAASSRPGPPPPPTRPTPASASPPQWTPGPLEALAPAPICGAAAGGLAAAAAGLAEASGVRRTTNTTEPPPSTPSSPPTCSARPCRQPGSTPALLLNYPWQPRASTAHTHIHTL